MNSPSFNSAEVKSAFEAYSETERACLCRLRDIIFRVAARIDSVGPLEECLKWGQPSYLTSKTKSGTTIRLGRPKNGGTALYVHCQTSLISDFKNTFPDGFDYEGNRAIIFKNNEIKNQNLLEAFIQQALTYHLKK